MGYVDRFIKKINLDNSKYKNKTTILPNLKPGDIIWAKRYSKEEVRKNIQLEHQESPFIVIYKNELNIAYCLECSSKEQTKAPNIIKLEKQNYPNILFRDTYVKLKSDIEMTSYRYLRKIGELLPQDFNLLKKTLFLLMTDEKVQKLFSFPKNKLVYYLDSGDIIQKGSNYLLISYRTDTSYITYNIIKDEENPDLNINNKPYKIIYNKRKAIPQDNVYVLYAIYHKFKSYYNREKYTGYHIADIGDLIQLNNTYYLVHGKYKQYLVVIQIYTNTKGKKIKTYNINIHNDSYFTGFEFFLLPSEHEYNIVSNILEFEICEYMNKMKINNITPNLTKDKILKIENSYDITLSTLQKEIIQQLEEMDFTLEEIIGIMTCIKDPKDQLKFKKYLTINYDIQDKEKIRNKALNIENSNKKEELKVGDIILAKRENDPNFKNNIIKDNAPSGPYIILHIDNECNVYAMSGTYATSGGNKTIFKVETKCKGVFKEDIIHIKSTLPVEITKYNYIKKVDELSKEDLNTLIKNVYTFLYFYPYPTEISFEKEKLSYYNSPLDIVLYKNVYYLIFDEDDKYFYTYNTYETKNPDFKINDIGYMINFKAISKLQKYKNYKVVYVLKEKLFKIIQNKKIWKDCDNLPTVKNIKKIPQRGDIITYNDNPYLIFGEYKNYFQVYKLYNENSKEELYTISTDTKTYKINFIQYVISKNTSVNIKEHITAEKLDEINNKKKVLKKTNTISYKPLDFREEKTTELNNEQLLLINKFKKFKFSKKEIIGTIIALNNKFVIEEILDFITKKEQNSIIDKNELTQRILKIIRN